MGTSWIVCLTTGNAQEKDNCREVVAGLLGGAYASCPSHLGRQAVQRYQHAEPASQSSAD